jgi:release factor glutamine methyltransferase
MGVGVATVGQAVAAARAVLEHAGLADPGREADELYAALVCGASSRAWLDRSSPAAPPLEARLLEAAEKRARGWPQAYAAGRANFRGHWLSVDQRVLIPRPETEGLVELVLEWARGKAGQGHSETVVDVGTGSGAIAIALALESSVPGIIATDVSAEALNVAMGNAEALGAKERISFRRGSLLGPLLGEKVGVIVSNPPYVATGEWEGLEAGVRDYEPRLALDGGSDGLAVTRSLLLAAREALWPGGLVALEVDARRARAAADLAAAAGLVNVELRRDLFGLSRYLTALAPEEA